MPASPGPDPFARPSRPVTLEAVAEWELGIYPALRPYKAPPPGTVDLDDVLPDTEEALDDPDLAAVTIAEELGA